MKGVTMKCISVFEEKVVRGIGVSSLPFPQIITGKRKGQFTYIPVDPSIVKDWKEVCRINDIIAKKGLVYDAFPIPIHRLHDNVWIYKLVHPVSENANNSVIVYWELTSGYNGQANTTKGICPARTGKILILGKKYHFQERKKVAETAICVCTLAEGQYIEGEITGHNVFPRKMLLNNGYHLVASSVY